MNEEKFNLSSDRGKLQLASDDIYKFDGGKKPYNSSTESNILDLEEKFNATIKYPETDPKTGFSGYTFETDTGEIVIAYVGTQTDKDLAFNIGTVDAKDVKEDAKIGWNNIFNTNIPVDNYDKSDEYYKMIREKYPDKKITVIGHSLAGGSANTVVVRNPGDNVESLTYNPAPILDSDFEKYGSMLDERNIRNAINEYDPLYQGVKAMDFIIPGQKFIIENGAGHSNALKDNDFDTNSDLIRFKTLPNNDETGVDTTPSILELVKASGALYAGITYDGKEVSAAEKIIGGGVVRSIMRAPGISHLLVSLSFAADIGEAEEIVKKVKAQIEENMSKLNGIYEGAKSKVIAEAIKFSIVVSTEINSTIDEAVDWIETNLARCKELVMKVLESVFDHAVDFLAGCIAVYLTLGEIQEIATEIAASLVQDILDLFEGDFVLDTSITAIVGDHIRSNRNALTNLFMNDSRRGIDRSLLNEVAKDIKEFSEELKEFKEDVSSAVVSMMAKDEELYAVKYH